MIINNVGYEHRHDSDFIITRPKGWGDYLLIVLKSKSVFTLNGKDIIVPENTVFIYDINTPQYYRSYNGEPFLNDWVHFNFKNDELEKFKDLDIPLNTPLTIDNITNISFFVKCISTERCSESKYSSKSMDCYMNLLFYKLSEIIHENEPCISDSNYEMLSTIKNKIYSKPYEHRTIEGSAHEVRMSTSSFQHLYKKLFGISFINDLINSRIEYAKWHLTQTGVSVKRVSEICGYNNQTHFFRQFKSVTGMTPQEYRNKSKLQGSSDIKVSN